MSFSIEKIEEIESQTKDILFDFYADREILPPITIGKITQAYGLEIRSGEFKNPAISGAFDRSKQTIYIAKQDSYARKAFTVAHEFAHYILHADKLAETFYRSNGIVTTDQDKPVMETEADCFAANLLMPKDLIEQFWPFVHDPDQMAILFRVSPMAMFWRLKNLGLTS